MSVPKISKKVLEDFYRLRSLFERIQSDQWNDRQTDITSKIGASVQEGRDICNKYINDNPPQ